STTDARLRRAPLSQPSPAGGGRSKALTGPFSPSPACGGGPGWGPAGRHATSTRLRRAPSQPSPASGEVKRLRVRPPPLAGEGRGGGQQVAALPVRAFGARPHPNLPPQAGEGADGRGARPCH